MHLLAVVSYTLAEQDGDLVRGRRSSSITVSVPVHHILRIRTDRAEENQESRTIHGIMRVRGWGYKRLCMFACLLGWSTPAAAAKYRKQMMTFIVSYLTRGDWRRGLKSTPASLLLLLQAERVSLLLHWERCRRQKKKKSQIKLNGR